MASLRVTWIGRQVWERRMRDARRKLRAELRKQTRKAGNLIRAQARRNVKTMFRASRTKFKFSQSVQSRKGQGLSAATTTGVRTRRGSVIAEVGAGGREGAYGKVHEEGRTVQRASRSGGSHTARYKRVPWLSKAVEVTAGRVFEIIGRAFRVV